MTASILQDRIRVFKSSSSFTPGDAFSFSIRFGDDLKLPGKFDPAYYLERLGEDVSGKRVCVVCPGNAGLCVELLRLGAASVVAYEPRSLYQKALLTISEITKEAMGRTFDLDKTLNQKHKHNLIFWTEGVDDIQDPKELIGLVLGSLACGGTLYLELAHGTNGAVPDSTNSWKPTKDGVAATVAAFAGLKIIGTRDGRNQTRSIYIIRNETRPEEKVTAPVAALRGPAPETVDDVQYFVEKLRAGISEIKQGTPKSPDVAPVLPDPPRKAPAVDSQEMTPEELERFYGDNPDLDRGPTPKSNARKRQQRDNKS